MCKLNESENLNLVPLKQYAKENRKSILEIYSICLENKITVYQDCPECDPSGKSPKEVYPDELHQAISSHQRDDLYRWDEHERLLILQAVMPQGLSEEKELIYNSLFAFLDKLHVATYFDNDEYPTYVFHNNRLDCRPKFATKSEARSKLRKEFKKNGLKPCKHYLNEIFEVFDSATIFIDTEDQIAS